MFTITNIFIGLYTIVLAYIVYRSSQRKDPSEFLDSGKSLNTAQTTWTTFASLLTGYNFVIGVTFSYLYGFWFLFAFLGMLCAFVVLYFLYKKVLHSYQKDTTLFSIGDYFGERFGAPLKHIVNTILCISLLLFLTVQLSVNTGLFSSLLGITPITALAVTAGAVAIYLWFGGFKASVSTDIFQGLLMLPIFLTVLYIPQVITISTVSKGFEASSFVLAIGLALLQFLSLLGQAESFQRVFATKDSRSLKKGLMYASILLIAIAGSIAYVGVSYKIAGTAVDPAQLFTQGLLPSLPTWLRSLLTVSLIAAFMGTIDSSAFAFGTILSNYKKRAATKIVMATKLYMVLGILIASQASLYLMSFLATVFVLISLVSIVGGSVLLAFMQQTTNTDMLVYYFVSVVVFVAGTIFGFITADPITSCIPIVAGYIAYLVFRLVLGNRPRTSA
jgi:Na+/proline symporter